MHGLKSGSCRFWQRTDLPPGSNMLRRAAQTCSACKLAGVQIIPLPTLANQILARKFFRSVANLFAYLAVEKFCRASSAGPRLSHSLLLEMGNQCRKTTLVAHFRGSTLQCLRTSVCVTSRWKVLSGEFRRRPTALAIKLRKSDRVGRRGLSEPREDFSRLRTYTFPRLCPWLFQHRLFNNRKPMHHFMLIILPRP